MLREYIKNLADNKEIYLKIKVLPRAGANEIQAILEDGTIKISLKAQPERGRANQELIKFLAEEFSLGKEQIKIMAGAGDRNKLVKLTRG